MTIKVEFTPEEVESIRLLLDAAVRGAGLDAAVRAVPIVQKLSAALNEAAKQKVVPISRAKARKQPAA